jgi:four helix bundle protein
MDHEKLDVYKLAIKLNKVAFSLIEELPRGQSAVADQLRRAAVSVPCNIAEGMGREPGPDRARFLLIARGSAMECAALFDVIDLLGTVDGEGLQKGKSLVRRIVGMLTRLIFGKRNS